MNRNWKCPRAFFTLLLLPIAAGCAHHAIPADAVNDVADGAAGMWLPNALPMDRLQSRFHFSPTPEWVEHLRLSSVRIGASGSFVSADGLILTNHHVAAGGLQNISTPSMNYLAHGFFAKTREDEKRIPGMEASVLETIEDVTTRVTSAMPVGISAAEALKARHAVLADIERESLAKTGLQSQVVTLYGGAMYHLYRYKRYTDIRAVFAPEESIAFFGGDPDNFEYPRYDLDITFLRAYEDGKPAQVKHHLQISSGGVRNGEAIFVSGHPGNSDRLRPVALLEEMRDHSLPLRISQMERMEKVLQKYAKRSPEAARQAEHDIFSIQNGLKATRPRLEALRQEAVANKRGEEAILREKLRGRADLRQMDAAWDRLGAIEERHARLFARHLFLEEGRAFGTRLFHDARELVRLPVEDAKPDSDRLSEYTQARRESLDHGLSADRPFYPEMEIVKLAESLRMFRDTLGPADPDVRDILGRYSPEERAADWVNRSKLGNAAERQRLKAGGREAVGGSIDSMIQLAARIDERSRALRQEFESTVVEPQTQALTEINKARFALLGTNDYPDATGTLRFAFGVVKGYEQEGRSVPPWTTMGGAFDYAKKHGNQSPYDLPASWKGAQEKIRGSTPFNFVSTADITGGNSGSPIVNREGELVGVIFDSNRQGVVNDFAYSDVQARAVGVDSRAILEALRKIYGADRLVEELLKKTP